MNSLAGLVPILLVLSVLVFYAMVIRGRKQLAAEKRAAEKLAAQKGRQSRVLVKVYDGRQVQALRAYQADAGLMAAQGYVPLAQNWTAGSYGGGQFFVAFVLCFLVIGIIPFVYMLIVKPAGTLAVTYELRGVAERM